MRRHPGNRSLQLLVAVVQLMFILYCLMMGAGQVLWAYVMARFLCVRTHMTR
jgi:phage shock protein PspC (stress-responsive transcriptional regulator)